jgi:MoxR-like ATPase
VTTSTSSIKDLLQRARAEVRKVIIGQEAVIDQALIAIVTGHHALVEGVPGVAKTLLVRTLARVWDVNSIAFQFTPDLMPADITGTTIYDMQRGEFTLVAVPSSRAFSSPMRSTVRRQRPIGPSAGDARARVTIDRDTHALTSSFTVFATQNPVEYEGTYPLPEAQKDRFMLKIVMRVPERDEELELARRMLGTDAPEVALAAGVVQPVISEQDLTGFRAALEAITMREELVAYIVDVIRATRASDYVLVGAGPRATQALLLASRAAAALSDRDFVTPDDVKSLCEPVIGHRLVLRPEHELEGVTIAEVVGKILEQVAVPR